MKGTTTMSLGLGSLKKPAASKKDSPKTANDASDILKKMDEKADAGICPFC